MLNNRFISISRKSLCKIATVLFLLNVIQNPVIPLQISPVILELITASASAETIADVDSDTTETVIREETDTLTPKVFLQASQWKTAVQACIGMIDNAHLRGYSFSTGELAAHIFAYTKAFPKIPIDSEYIKNEIVIGKYIENEINFTPSPAQVKNCYSEFTKQSPLIPPPSQNEISPLLENQILFFADSTIQLCEKMRQQKEQSDREEMARAMVPWPYWQIAIDTNPIQCLVTDPENNECVVNINDFNAYLSLHHVQQYIRLDTARAMALRWLLNDRFLSRQAEVAGLSDQDDLMQKQELWEQKKLLDGEHPFQSENINDKQLLIATYKKYYNRFFSKRTIQTLELIGSTDSLYIDSIYRGLEKIDADTVHDKISRTKEFIKPHPWVVVSTSDLPDTIVSSTVSLKIQHYITFSTSFGFFICRLIRTNNRSEINFGMAYHKLVYLIQEERAKSKNKSDSILAFEYYNQHKDKFLKPDTLITNAWLTPLNDTSSSNEIDEKPGKKKIALDTTTYSSKKMSSNDLPFSISDELVRRYRKINGGSFFIGPLTSRLGIWYFRVLNVKPGGKLLPFSDVRDTILKALEIQQLPFDSILSTEVGARIYRSSIKADLYRKRVNEKLKQSIRDLNDDEIKKLIQNKTIRISFENNDTSNTRLINMARSLLFDKKKQQLDNEAAKWIRLLSVDRRLLFTGCPKIIKD